MSRKARGFTILELLLVVAIIALLAGLVLPAMSRARESGRTLACLAHLKEFGSAWQMYADENEEVFVPARMPKKDENKSNKDNWYEVGNGLKYLPRWPAVLGAKLGIHAFDRPTPETEDILDRQDYAAELYQCPAEPSWIDERNYAYGYNYQFLGNARLTNNLFHNFPIKRHRVSAPGGTVVFADSMGTAAGRIASARGGYRNDEKEGPGQGHRGDHGYTLDPPRLTTESDRGTGDPESLRTAVDPRHQGKVNALFADLHGDTVTDRDLGYRTNRRGRYVDLDPNEEDGDAAGTVGMIVGFGRRDGQPRTKQKPVEPGRIEDAATNFMFSGNARDEDPPAVPKLTGQ